VAQEPKSADVATSGGLVAAAQGSEVCLHLSLPPPDWLEIHRYLGYPADATPSADIVQGIEQIVSPARARLEPRGAFSLYGVAGRTSRSLSLGAATITGNVGEFLGYARRVAVFVVTAGEPISRLSEDAGREGDAFAAWVLDALGSWAAEAAADALMERIRPHLGDHEALTLRYSPGYCGMDIAQQRVLFRLVPADSVGVKLLPSLLMRPLKSVSGVVGLGPKEAVDRYRAPCDSCPQVGCHMRR
jgi:hypothetical protein